MLVLHWWCLKLSLHVSERKQRTKFLNTEETHSTWTRYQALKKCSIERFFFGLVRIFLLHCNTSCKRLKSIKSYHTISFSLSNLQWNRHEKNLNTFIQSKRFHEKHKIFRSLQLEVQHSNGCAGWNNIQYNIRRRKIICLGFSSVDTIFRYTLGLYIYCIIYCIF